MANLADPKPPRGPWWSVGRAAARMHGRSADGQKAYFDEKQFAQSLPRRRAAPHAPRSNRWRNPISGETVCKVLRPRLISFLVGCFSQCSAQTSKKILLYPGMRVTSAKLHQLPECAEKNVLTFVLSLSLIQVGRLQNIRVSEQMSLTLGTEGTGALANHIDTPALLDGGSSMKGETGSEYNLFACLRFLGI